MASQGPLSPSTLANDAAFGTVAWTNPGNAAASDNAWAIATLPAALDLSQYLKAQNFGFTIPAEATVVGIQAEIERSRDAGGQNVRDQRVRIVKADGTIGATEKRVQNNFPDADAYLSAGGAADLWGETWTPADINDADFGVALAVEALGANTGSIGARVDHIRITVHYTETGAGVPKTNRLAMGGCG